MKHFSISSVVAAAALVASSAGHAASVSLFPNPAAAANGGQVTVTARLGAIPSKLSGFDLDVAYDKSKLSFVSSSFSSAAELGAGAIYSDADSGSDVEVFAASIAQDNNAVNALAQNLAGFDLFTLTFQALQADTVTYLSFASSSFNGQPIYPLLTFGFVTDTNGGLVAVGSVPSTSGTCVEIGGGKCPDGTNVPEPESFALTGVALLAAAGAMRRRRQLAR